TTFPTDQEVFWAGEFGDAYTKRNRGPRWIASNAALFARVFARAPGVGSVIEFGANIGLNLHAVRTLLPHATLAAVEINPTAAAHLREIPDLRVHETSLLEYHGEERYDLAFVKGVLIHVNPDRLPDAYDVLYRASGRYVLMAEYYNPTPVPVSYRGHTD